LTSRRNVTGSDVNRPEQVRKTKWKCSIPTAASTATSSRTDGESADHQRALSALGRYAEAAEIADTVAFLAGAGGRNITGAILTIDGGTNA